MPEMPEVTTVVNALRPIISNQTINKVEIYKDKLFQNCTSQEFKNFVQGETIKDIYNLGKHIIIELKNESFILNHLRMTGKYAFYQKYHKPTLHDHVVFNLSNGYLYFNDARAFATFHIKNKNELMSTKPLCDLGKVPDEIDVDWLFEKVKKRSVSIKNILLDQNLILGIGNIYANESLWECQLHPSTPANQINKIKLIELIKSAGQIMKHATELGGSSIQSYSSLNGKKGEYQNLLKVHNRENLNCYRCDNKIQKYWVSKRGTYYCPQCQKERNDL
ncbi:bifunctional DNA-formamidopyrimidine glycosylase/DNA-(apurinic or apyrimidinic site) lyase [Mycoplasma sp. ES3157-GEN-MYC]|uniref:Bifunctional DNA-formamidopyrimidine glycosylase/DNA-(Apurinic or apyrimidinic site) lyase n=1 Tax=Mycoplasma miroungigenitalium TaxID=754515 RepID=A0A6M4JA30_9MOLU|nr:bifunctional DNA-formamidopyrimidine glycosylase/DNA-(apurinic or apyrimidinic site) lyase [Mycoplasma miroungigenitalium]MBU4690682.1 bifunctional DNA-formamidopyrimidine glycosylase/DNA-(apurinic or apyrimidinic site) lyase [Mycoplasma miroungigenitalium]MBU4691951.1 bifunctional DNA-formamidopyrimidine glycosylase/DNA-(apurinic or apyrimidinic site) lyase [Mycoplasma miroungigenitalium]QJR43803.1 bifunctional DNA-formamidopyrimidine glycosylase/DNA-(apurinic or apyrimidinic site) lyase [My